MNFVRLFLVCIGFVSCSFATDYYVSPAGDDGNPGTEARPFKTIEAARDALRGSAKGGGNILLRGGHYFLDETLAFDERDSGVPGAPNGMASYPGEQAHLVGGVQVPASALRKTTDEAILKRILSPVAREHIYEIDLKGQGITDYGKIIPHGFHRAVQPAPIELSIDGKRLRMAQWPNEDDTDKAGRGAGSEARDIHYIKMPRPVSRGSRPRYKDYKNIGGVIPYDYERPDHYESHDMIMAGYLGNGYSYDTIPIAKIDKEKKQISLSAAHMYGLGNHRKWGQRGHTEYFFLNVLEEIDQPGESYLDRETGKIYFMLPDGVEPSAELKVFAGMMEEPIVAVEEASHFRLENLTIESGRTMGIYMEGGEDNRIDGCTLRNLGTAAIMLGKGVDADPVVYRHEYTGTPTARMMGSIMCHTYANTTFNRNAGKNHRINNCHIYDVGVIGIYLGGGDRVTLEPGNNVVSNCRIHRTQNVERSFFGAVTMDGVGNTVEHCEIFDLFDIAFWNWGNDHVVRFNEVHHCLQSASEKGLIYMGRNPGIFNFRVENNFFHHNGNPYGLNAIVHMDDYSCGMTFKNNICYKNDRKFFFNSGYLQTVENNVFLDDFVWDERPVNYEHGIRHGQTVEKWKQTLATHEVIKERIFKVVDVRNPPYSTRYPQLAEIVNEPEKSFGSVVVRDNVCINSGILTSHRKTNPGGGNVTNNWVAENADYKTLHLGFANVEKLDFRMSPDSEVFKKVPGFKRIDFEKIGPETDADNRCDATCTRNLHSGAGETIHLSDSSSTGEEQQVTAPIVLDGSLVKVSHILAGGPGFESFDDAKKKAAKEKIAQARLQIQEGVAFEDVAQEFSDCPSGQKGGALNVYFDAAGRVNDEPALVPEFSAAAHVLSVGESSDIIETRYGYHIIKCTDRETAEK